MVATAEAAEVESAFVDDDWNIHETNINAIAAAEITRGCNPPASTKYCPDRAVTRGQMAAFLVRSFGYTESEGDAFIDDDDSIFEGDIDKLATAGVTQGCNPPVRDRYCPNAAVTRAEMASFLARALGLDPVEDGPFIDTSATIHRTAINAIAARGITFGCNPPANDRYCPGDSVTRAQMASFLARTLELEPILNRVELLPGSTCDRSRLNCSASLSLPGDRRFEVREGWYNVLPFGTGEESAFTSSATSFTLSLNGLQLATEASRFDTATQATREWRTVVADLGAGTHTLKGVWRWEGTVNLVVTVTLDVG